MLKQVQDLLVGTKKHVWHSPECSESFYLKAQAMSYSSGKEGKEGKDVDCGFD
jgi:hypothetical protein